MAPMDLDKCLARAKKCQRLEEGEMKELCNMVLPPCRLAGICPSLPQRAAPALHRHALTQALPRCYLF